MATRILSVIGMALLMACGAEPAARSTGLPPMAPPTAAPAPSAPPAPVAAEQATDEERYRSWMEEARLRHPYPEPVEVMWAVMLCESEGDPTVVYGPYHGLFQYQLATWGGSWNPYRDQPVLDPQAQIFATAKAWQDGYQSWWGCYQATS